MKFKKLQRTQDSRGDFSSRRSTLTGSEGIIFWFAASFLLASGASPAAPGDIIGSFTTGAPVYASPALGPDGTIYIGSNDARCYALEWNSEGLKQRWVYPADDWIDSSAAMGPDGTVYIATYNSTLAALDPVTGTEHWTVSVGETEGAFSVIQASPAIAADGAIVLTTIAGFAHAYDPDGNELWSFEIGEASQSSPVIDQQGNIYFGADDGKVYCLNASGEVQWTFAVDTAGAEESRIRSSPAIDSQGNLYVGAGDGFLYSLTANGALRWKFQTPEAVDSTPAIDRSNQIYFGSRNGSLYCVDQGGELVWSTYLGDIFYSSPVIDDNGFVYATYFGGQGKSLVIAFAPGGVEVWQTQIEAVIDSSLTISPDGILYVGGFDGTLYAIEGSGGALDYLSPWPRFRKDIRGRGRVIPGSLPDIATWPSAGVTREGGGAEFSVVTADAVENQYFWRKNGNVIRDTGSSTLTLGQVTKDAVGIYDVIVSNQFGEILSPPTFLALYAAPSYTVLSSLSRFSTQFTYPDLPDGQDVVITRSTDLVHWTSEDLVVQPLASLTEGNQEVTATFTTSELTGFFRLERVAQP